MILINKKNKTINFFFIYLNIIKEKKISQDKKKVLK